MNIDALITTMIRHCFKILALVAFWQICLHIGLAYNQVLEWLFERFWSFERIVENYIKENWHAIIKFTQSMIRTCIYLHNLCIINATWHGLSKKVDQVMQEEANHLLGQFQHKNKFHMANQGIKQMHRLQYFKSDCQVEEVANENGTISGIEKSKGHQNRRKTQKSK